MTSTGLKTNAEQCMNLGAGKRLRQQSSIPNCHPCFNQEEQPLSLDKPRNEIAQERRGDA